MTDLTPEGRPVMLLPGDKSAVAAEDYFGDIYDCDRWFEGEAESNPKPFSNGQLAPYAGRRVTVWGAARNTPSADPVISELLHLKCTVRYIDMDKHVLEPRVAKAGNMERDALYDFAKKQATDITEDPIRHIHWRRLAGKTPPERPWVINHWLTDGATLFAGKGGIGKTHVAQTMATAIALGMPYVDEISQPRRVLFWACEDDENELWRRQIAISNHFEASFANLDNLIIHPRVGMDNSLFVQRSGAAEWRGLRDELRQQVNDYRAEVLILDNIGQLFGGNENDRHHVTAFVSGLRGLTERSIPIILLGHPAKAEGSEFSGSTAWEAAVRMRWYLGRDLPDKEDTEESVEKDDNRRYLCKRKANYSHLDYRELNYIDGVYACAQGQDGPTFQQKYASQARRDFIDAVVLECIRQFAERGIRTVDSSNSPDSAVKKIRELHMHRDATTKELQESVSRLRLSGRLVEKQYGMYSNRTPKMGLGVAHF